MGDKLERQPVDVFMSTSELLRTAARALENVARQMNEAKMTDALFYWNQRHFDAIDLISKAASQCEGMIGPQIQSKKTGRESSYEITLKRSKRDETQKKLKKRAILFVTDNNLIDEGVVLQMTLRQLAGLLALNQSTFPREDVAALLEEIRESGVDFEKDTAINETKSRLKSRGLIKPPVAESPEKPTKKASKKSSGKPPTGRSNRGKNVSG